jgi:hypothetical protein
MTFMKYILLVGKRSNKITTELKAGKYGVMSLEQMREADRLIVENQRHRSAADDGKRRPKSGRAGPA